MKKVLITGANGFIGKNLKELLATKYKVFAITRQELDLLDTVSVAKFFKNKHFDVVIHTAVVGGKRNVVVDSALNKNLTMFFNLVGQKKHFDKFINLGSGAEYDKSRPIIKIKEEEFGLCIPKDDYGLYKYVCSQFIEGRVGFYNLRLFGVYGKYEDDSVRFISGAIKQNLARKPIKINQNVVFDYLYIDDLARILEFFIDKSPKFNVYNVASGERVDLVTIANMINSVSSFKSKIIVANKGLNKEYTANVDRLKKDISNFKLISTINSLKVLLIWYRDFI